MSRILTPWFPHTVKPTREGVYQVKSALSVDGQPPAEGWAYWNGERWGWRMPTPYRAFTGRSTMGAAQNKLWRGMTREGLRK